MEFRYIYRSLHSIAAHDSALFIAIEAKHASEFNKGKPRLLTYLTILTERRIKSNSISLLGEGGRGSKAWGARAECLRALGEGAEDQRSLHDGEG